MTDVQPKVNTDVPIHVHPDILIPFEEDASAGKEQHGWGTQALNAGRGALTVMHDDIAGLAEAERVVARIEADGRGSLSADLSNAAQRAFDRAAAKADSGMKSIARAREGIEAAIAQAVNEPKNATSEGITTANAIRAHVASLPSASERTAFLYGRVRTGDRQTADAVLRGPAYLSGLSDEAHALLRAEAAATFAPELDRQRAAVDKITARIEEASRSLVERYAKVVKATEETRRYDSARRTVAKIGGAA